MTSNLPADFREEEELSPEEQVALAEARDNDMDDDSDDAEQEDVLLSGLEKSRLIDELNHDVEPQSEQEEYEASQE